MRGTLWKARGLRSIGILGLGVLLICVSAASAASPVDNGTFSGPTAHHKYTVGITAVCYTKTYEPRDCARPTNVSVNLTPTPRKGSKCPDAGVAFTDVTLTPFKISANGSFTGTGEFSTGKPQLTFTVSGRFVTRRLVEGVVRGNSGCGNDNYKIKVAASG